MGSDPPPLPDAGEACRDAGRGQIEVSAERSRSVDVKTLRGAGKTPGDAAAAAQRSHHNHPVALLGEIGSKGIDLMVAALAVMAGAIDRDFARLTAAEIQHFMRHQIIEDDDIGRLQRANGAQCQQIRMIGVDADRCNRAAFRRIARIAGDEAIEIVRVRWLVGTLQPKRSEALPELAPPGAGQA